MLTLCIQGLASVDSQYELCLHSELVKVLSESVIFVFIGVNNPKLKLFKNKRI